MLITASLLMGLFAGALGIFILTPCGSRLLTKFIESVEKKFDDRLVKKGTGEWVYLDEEFRRLASRCKS